MSSTRLVNRLSHQPKSSEDIVFSSVFFYLLTLASMVKVVFMFSNILVTGDCKHLFVFSVWDKHNLILDKVFDFSSKESSTLLHYISLMPGW